jgi:hypothetical protein
MDLTATTLRDDHQARQVKKLVLAACTGNWENDPQQLATFSLSNLLVDLMQRYPSPDQLKGRLYGIVDNLNKKQEYRQVAQLVVDQLEPLYLPIVPGAPEPTGLLAPLPPASKQSTAKQAAPKQPTFKSGVLEEFHPEPQILGSYLFDAQTINALLAEPETDQIPASLYPPSLHPPSYPQASHPQPQPTAQPETAQIAQPETAQPKMAQPAQPKVELLVSDELPIRNPILLELAADTETFELTQPFSFAAASYIAPEVLQPPVLQTSQPQVSPLPLPEDWFDIRWEIMKYANPLSVKILLYSAVYEPFSFDPQDWQRLQNLAIDDLLSGLVGSSTSLAEIEQKLQETAAFLEQAASLTTGTLSTAIPALIQALQGLKLS